jgi:acyl-CoA synthetase (AMP-forming)/AMP-acid ligase II
VDPLTLPGHRIAVGRLAHEATLPSMLAALARRFGDRCAFSVKARSISYAELEQNSAHLARGLLAAGVGKGTRVGILMPAGPDFAEAFFAAARIGALPIPLSTFYQARELSLILRHADVDTLLVRDRYLKHDYLERLEEIAPELERASRPYLFLPSLPALRSIWVWGDSERPWTRRAPDELRALADALPAIDREFLRGVEAQVSPADAGVVIYTSGTTEHPKGVVHTQGTLIRHSHILNRYFFPDLQAGDGLYSNMPVFWVGGLVLNTLAVLHAGGCLYNETPLAPTEILDLVFEKRIPYLMLWGHQSAELFRDPRFSERDYSFVRRGPIDTLGQPIPAERACNSLGMTETAGMHSIEPMNQPLASGQAGSFGRPLPGIEQRIVDPRSGLDAEEGELWVRGYSLMQGLYKREREEVFEPDGYYRTGDICERRPDGHIVFKGRLNEMIKTRGANVSPREVELLLEAMPEVRRAAVLGLGDPVRGQQVAAAIVLEPGASVRVEALRSRLAAQLSSFKVPRDFHFLDDDELPLTASDKVRKPDLLRLLELREPGRTDGRLGGRR